MDKKEFDKLFGFWKKEKIKQAKTTAPAKGKDCLYFTELEAYAKKGGEALTSAKNQHIQSCVYCQKMIATFEKAMQEEQVIPIYERLGRALGNLINALALPFRALPRFAPALVPVLAVILIFVMFSNQPLELKNYSFEFTQPSIATRGATSENKFKIRLVSNHDSYVYLFAIEKDKASILFQEKVAGNVEATLPKEGWLEGGRKLVLLLAKNPLKDPLSTEAIIAKNYHKGEKETQEALRKESKRKDILTKFL